ncbi:MAG: sulfurtransferase complex subunit TusB [Gammaproteobacteria bacterium]|jgi:sulfur relay protein TusB/DsrH|nr:sulfurtransferase complex subunit TusB [Gammaproteobacteria bacterium]|tara:strand:- start:176 stop:466 length:291 start_codon:yes stop_codon:yes gene_type:complete
MSCLHTISKSSDLFDMDTCISVLGSEDALLFIEDGVYFCIGSEIWKGIDPECKIYVQLEDLQARGLVGKTAPNVESVNYDEFVRLCCTYDKVVSWF